MKAAGKFSGVKTSSEGKKYFIETGTRRHINKRFGIPVATVSPKGKVTRKLVGTFNTIAGALAWAYAHSPQPHHELIRNALCDYYGQPRELKPGPTSAMIKADPTCDARFADDANIPGVMLAGEYTVKKRKAGAIKEKTPKAAKKKPVKIKGAPGITLVRATKNPAKAMVQLEGALDVVKQRQRLAKMGSQLVEVDDNGVSYVWQQAVNEDRAAKLKPNPWAGDGRAIQGDFLVISSKKFTLVQSDQ